MYYRYVYSHCIHGLFYCNNWNPPWFARNIAMAIQGWSWSGRKYRGLLLHICLAPSAPWQNALRSKGILSSHLHFNRHRIEVLIFKIWEDAWTKKNDQQISQHDNGSSWHHESFWGAIFYGIVMAKFFRSFDSERVLIKLITKASVS